MRGLSCIKKGKTEPINPSNKRNELRHAMVILHLYRTGSMKIEVTDSIQSQCDADKLLLS